MKSATAVSGVRPIPGCPISPMSSFTARRRRGSWSCAWTAAGGMRIVCAPYMQQGLAFVTYTHADPWRWEIPAFKGALLPRTLKKLQGKEELTVLFYGDSVTSGDDVTSQTNVPPYTPLWTQMFVDNLERAYGTRIRMVDTALGGTDTRWGIENLKTHVIDYRPDLAVIGFGANDPA